MAAELIKTLLLSWMLTVLIESLSAFLAGLRGLHAARSSRPCRMRVGASSGGNACRLPSVTGM